CCLRSLESIRIARRSPLFPYTTLFRSRAWALTQMGVELSPLMAEEAKFRLGHLRPPEGSEVDPIPVAGKNLKTGLPARIQVDPRSEEHTSELQSRENLVCRLLLEKKKK